MLKLLFIGDIVGRPGRDLLAAKLPRVRRDHGVDFVIANGENAAAGAGITGSIAKSILESGVDAITLGDHVWDQRGWETEIAQIEHVCRPANLPKACPGWDHLIIEARGFRVGVFTVLGRTYMNLKAECPFLTADRMIDQLKAQCDAIIVEMHAEATAEKYIMGHYCDGRATAVVGAHTHVPTADAQILPGGTAYLTDAGMCGDYDSVIGMKKGPLVQRAATRLPVERKAPAEGPATMCGVYIESDDVTGLATRVEMIRVGGRLKQTIPVVDR